MVLKYYLIIIYLCLNIFETNEKILNGIDVDLLFISEARAQIPNNDPKIVQNLKKLNIAIDQFKKSSLPTEKANWCDKIVKIEYLLFKYSKNEKYKKNLSKAIKTCSKYPISNDQKSLYQKFEKDLGIPTSFNLESPSTLDSNVNKTEITSLSNTSTEVSSYPSTNNSSVQIVNNSSPASWVFNVTYYSW
jgi:hypothetical protein